MCFSAEASFIAGVGLSAAGVATIRMARDRNEIPFAMVPLIFGIHQLIEGFVWLSFQLGDPLLNSLATNLYLFFARAFWPIFFPLAVGLLEPVLWRKKILFGFSALGIASGFYFLYSMIEHPMTSSLLNGHIVYKASSYYAPYWMFFFSLYVAATTVSCLFSSHRMVNVMGILLFFFGLITYFLYLVSFASVWCFFAAILSIVVYLHFRYRVFVSVSANFVDK